MIEIKKAIGITLFESDNYGGWKVRHDECSPTIRANKVSMGAIEVREVRLGNIYGDDKGTGFAGNVWDDNYIAPAITTMQGGMRQPMIVSCAAMRGRNNNDENYEQRLEMRQDELTNTITTVQKDNVVVERDCLRMVRTDEGKALRKQYEAHEIHHGFNEHREAEIRPDGLCNSISTVQKDNLILERKYVLEGNNYNQRCVVNDEDGICRCIIGSGGTGGYHAGNEPKVLIKQATKSGYIPCEIGGGSGSELPNKQNTQRKSDRERNSLSDSDNGECP